MAGGAKAAGVCVGIGCSLCLNCCVFFCFVAPINIVEIVLGAIWMYDCTAQPVDLGVWLLVLGCVGLGVGGLFTFLHASIICIPCAIILAICLECFYIAWIVVGGIAIFDEPGWSSCYNDGSPEAIWITCVVFWCLAILGFFFHGCYHCGNSCSTCTSSLGKSKD